MSPWDKDFWKEEARRFLFGAGGSSGFSVSTLEWLGDRLMKAQAWDIRLGHHPDDISEMSFVVKKRDEDYEKNK